MSRPEHWHDGHMAALEAYFGRQDAGVRVGLEWAYAAGYDEGSAQVDLLTCRRCGKKSQRLAIRALEGRAQPVRRSSPAGSGGTEHGRCGRAS